MFVACSTLCFARHPLEDALRQINDLEFGKMDVAIHAEGPHLTPLEVMEDVPRAAQRLKSGHNIVPSAFSIEIDAEEPDEFDRQLRALCHLARLCTVAVLTMPAAAAGQGLDAEVKRLTRLVKLAQTEGCVLTVDTRTGTLTESPDAAVELCQRVPGLGITLDPSHYIAGPNAGKNFDQVFPFVYHVHLRDTGRGPGQFQVRVGQGEVEYGRIINQLVRYNYDRLLTVQIYDHPDASCNMEHEVRKLKYLLESLV